MKRHEQITTERNDSGASLVEYALLLALIALVCVTGISAVGTGIKNTFYATRPAFTAAGGGGVICEPGTPGFPDC